MADEAQTPTPTEGTPAPESTPTPVAGIGGVPIQPGATPEATSESTPVPDPTPDSTPEPFNWRNFIPEDLKEAPTWGKFKDGEEGIADILKSYRHLEEMSGSKLSIPEAEDHEGWQKLYNQLGRPESSEGYTINYPDFDGNVQWNEAYTSSLAQMAHSAGFNNKQVQIMVDWYAKTTVDNAQKMQEIQQDQLKEVRETYGPSADKFFAQANALLEKVGGTELLEVVGQNPIAYDPVFVKGMVKMAQMFNEDDLVVTGVQGLTTRDEAKAKINEIRNDPEHPFNKGDKAAMKEIERLYALAYN